MNRSRKTFVDAFVAATFPNQTLAQANGEAKDINLSAILTVLIQMVGRFVETFASDLWIDWQEVLDFINQEQRIVTDTIFVLGLRKHGVDGINFTLNRLRDTLHPDRLAGPYINADAQYRKVLALQVSVVDGYASLVLKDITDELFRMANEDMLITEDTARYVKLCETIHDEHTDNEYVVERYIKRSWLQEYVEADGMTVEEFLNDYDSEDASAAFGKAVLDGAYAFSYAPVSRTIVDVAELGKAQAGAEHIMNEVWRVDAYNALELAHK